jgi:hypothetical protein
MNEFGKQYIGAIKTLYHNIETCITNNGYSSRYFKPTRGIRQGYPISALLFLLVVEVMANARRNNPRISGINIGDSEWRIWTVCG